MQPRNYFVTFDRKMVSIHDAANGAILATKMPPMGSNDYITDASGDSSANYVTVSCSNRSIFVYKKGGPTSWFVYKQYTR